MKEYPEPNYFLRVLSIDADEPELARLLPESYYIRVNLIVRIAVMPYLPESPWPPSFPSDVDRWKDRDEAAVNVFATNDVTLARSSQSKTRIQTVIFDEYPELSHTVFRIPAAEYDALFEDVARLPDSQFRGEPRLNELGNGPLAKFLKQELPQSSLLPYQRKILCLDPLPDRSI